MNLRALLSIDEREALLRDCPEWVTSADQRAISRRYTFPDFESCFAFMTRCALLAQAHNHHPDFIQSYTRLDVTLTTHDAGGLTTLDARMARAIQAFTSS